MTPLSPAARRAWMRALLLSAVAFGLFMRVWRPTADAPGFTDWSVGIWTDEGIYAQNAWNHLHFGRWMLDQFAPMAVTPVQTFLERGLFGVFGSSLVVMRVLAIVVGTLGSALVVVALAKTGGRALGVAALLLVALDPVLASFTRLALNETTMLPVLAGALWLAADRASRPRLFFAGLLAVVAFVVKPFGLIVAPIVGVAIVLDRWSEPAPRWSELARRLVAFGLPVLLGVAAVLVFAYLPHRAVVDSMLHYFGGNKLGRSFGRVVEDLYRNAFHDDFFQRFPVPGTLVLLAIGIVRRDDLRHDAALRLWIAWLAVTDLYLASLAYNPIRYYFVALPAVYALAAWAAVTAWKEPSRLLSRRLGVLLVVPVVHRAVRLVVYPHTFYGVTSQRRGFVVTGLFAAAGLVLLLARARLRPTMLRSALVALLVVVTLGWNVRRGLLAAWTPHYELRDTARWLRDQGLDGPIAGDWAVALQPHLQSPAYRVTAGELNDPSTWPALHARWYFGPPKDFANLVKRTPSLACWDLVGATRIHGYPMTLAHAGRRCDEPKHGDVEQAGTRE